MSKLQVRLKKSFIGKNDKQISIAKALGLHHVGDRVEVEDTPSTRGVLRKIDFMLDVKESE